jgi:hypothetical protein
MPMNVGPFEVLLVLLFVWGIPLALLAWFVINIREIRNSLRRIEQHMDRAP